MQRLLSLQVTAVPPHAPFVQTSLVVHRLLSLHTVPFAALPYAHLFLVHLSIVHGSLSLHWEAVVQGAPTSASLVTAASAASREDSAPSSDAKHPIAHGPRVASTSKERSSDPRAKPSEDDRKDDSFVCTTTPPCARWRHAQKIASTDAQDSTSPATAHVALLLPRESIYEVVNHYNTRTGDDCARCVEHCAPTLNRVRCPHCEHRRERTPQCCPTTRRASVETHDLFRHAPESTEPTTWSQCLAVHVDLVRWPTRNQRSARNPTKKPTGRGLPHRRGRYAHKIMRVMAFGDNRPALAKLFAIAGSVDGLKKLQENADCRYPFYRWSGTPTTYAMKPFLAEVLRQARRAIGR